MLILKNIHYTHTHTPPKKKEIEKQKCLTIDTGHTSFVKIISTFDQVFFFYYYYRNKHLMILFSELNMKCGV